MSNEVLILSDSAFFVKTIDVPAGVSNSDIGGFADMALEEFCPLPAEKTRRGFFRRGNKAVIFAALADSIFTPENTTAVKSSVLVLPDCALLCLSGAPDGFVFLRGSKCLSLALSKDGIFLNYRTLALEDTSEKTFESAKENLTAAVIEEGFADEKTDLAKIPVCKICGVKRAGSKIKISVQFEHGAETATTVLLKNALSCDMRAKNFNEQNRKKLIKQNIILWFTIAALAALGLAAVWQTFLFFGSAHLGELENRLAALQPHASEIEKLSEESARLAAFTGTKIHSIETLAKINELRPDGITFVRYGQNSAEDAEISGRAPNIAAVDTFVRALKRANFVKGVSAQTESTLKGAKFTIKIAF